ncbi:MAG: AraC family transcriptional regulator [Prevotella sp.]
MSHHIPTHILRTLLSVMLCAATSLSAPGQENYRVHCYDHITADILDMHSVVQDGRGFIWISSSDGLYRFDGYKMQDFRPKASEQTGVNSYSVSQMLTDSDGNIWCLIDRKALKLDVRTYRFTNVLNPLERRTGRHHKVTDIIKGRAGSLYMICADNTVLTCDTRRPEATAAVTHSVTADALRARNSIQKPFVTHDRYGNTWTRDNINAPGVRETGEIFADNQDNIWYIDGKFLYKVSFCPKLYSRLQTETDAMRWAMRDSRGRLWASSRKDYPISIYNADNSLQGYLTPDGRITPTRCPFTSRAYVIFEDSKHTIWIGTKPDGLYRLTPQPGGGAYRVENYRKRTGGLHDDAIIDILEDKEGRIWVTGFLNGLCCITDAHSARPVFTPVKSGVSGEMKFRRSVLIRQNAILSATSSGLMVYDLRGGLKALAAGKGVRHHTHEPQRAASLSSFALKTVLETSRGDILVCTRDAGIDIMKGTDVFAGRLSFKHINKGSGFPSDYVKSIIEHKGHLWVTSQNKIIEWNPQQSLPEGAEVRLTLDERDFSESNPERRADGTYVYGVTDGMISLSLDTLASVFSIEPQKYPLVLTSTADRDTIILESDNRTLNLTFATLDYDSPEHIAYAVRMSAEGEQGKWMYIGNTNSISFQHLEAGEYVLELRSTDSFGRWIDNTRRITVIVRPALLETWWMRTLYIIAILSLAVAVMWVRRYISNIKRQQHDTLNAYMQLINTTTAKDEREHDEYTRRIIERAQVEPQSDAMIKKVMEFVEQHIGNADIDIDQMAQYAAVSRSQLNHKLKQLMGVTPSEMIREARIKRACMLLRESDMSVNEIAYRCGFSDPKYFSKCFKASKGCSPTAFRVCY